MTARAAARGARKVLWRVGLFMPFAFSSSFPARPTVALAVRGANMICRDGSTIARAGR
jgi:hypothetical protein